MGKRAHGEGSIFQDADGVWWAQLPRDADGKVRRRRAKTQKEARDKLRAMLKERDQGVVARGRLQTVEQWCEHWLETKRPSWTRRTYDGHAYTLRKYVYPSLGGIRIDKLTPSQIERCLN